MFTRFKATCERIRQNNGIVEVLFTCRSDIGDDNSQEQHVLVNLPFEYGTFEKGKEYFIQIQPAFPY